jgi:hypothetical protein
MLFGMAAIKIRDVIPAKAGIHLPSTAAGAQERWIPAFAGMTTRWG